MDYRKLLIKYILYIAEQEGITFLEDRRRRHAIFTEEEWQEMKILDREADEVQ